MRLAQLALKNVSGNWWRSLALGMFVFLTSFILIIFNAFFMTISENMQDSLINALTGHIQIRSQLTQEEDMLSMKTSWSGVHHLSAVELAQVIDTLNRRNLEYTERVRFNAMLQHDLAQGHGMIVGLDPVAKQYHQGFDLEKGRYLDPDNPGEILLSAYHARQLGVEIGDELQAASESGTVNLVVVGIGDIGTLTMFGYNAIFTDLVSARTLAGFDAGEATDVIVFASSTGQTQTVFRQLQAEITGVTLTVWEDMGGFVFGGISLYRSMFVLFIIVMMLVVSILIFNLVLMMGMERRQEIGTLRAIGFSRWRIIQIFLGEILSIAVIFCALGLTAGSTLVLAFSNTGFEFGPPLDFAMGRVFFIRFDIGLVLPVAAIILLFTTAAALWPAWKAASLDPVEAMQE